MSNGWKKTALAAMLALAATAAEAKTKIGVIVWNDAEPRYSQPKDVILAELKTAGFDDSKVEIVVKNAEGKKPRVPEIVKELQDAKVDIFVPIGTSAAVPTAQAVKDKPVVFSVVYDPIEAKIAASWTGSGNNTTGSSSFTSIPNFLRRLIKRSGVAVKKIAVPFTPGEKNSEIQLAAVQSSEKDLGLTITPVPLTSPEDVAKWVKALPGSADLVVMTGSNVIGTNIQQITDGLVKAKIMSVTHLEDLVQRGVLMGLVADSTEIGQLAAKALVKVLKGEKPGSIAIEYPLPKLMINEKTAEAGQFKLPQDLRDWAASSAKKS